MLHKNEYNSKLWFRLSGWKWLWIKYISIQMCVGKWAVDYYLNGGRGKTQIQTTKTQINFDVENHMLNTAYRSDKNKSNQI